MVRPNHGGTMGSVPLSFMGFLSDPLSSDKVPLKEEVINAIGSLSELYDRREGFPLARVDGELLLIVSDLHGNLEGAKRVMDRFRSLKDGGKDVKLLVLGDMVDRSPRKEASWGPLTALYILGWKLRMRDDIFVLRGNHESYALRPFSPYDLPEELRSLYGAEGGSEVREAIEGLFDRLPLMALTGNGMAAVHASFPKDKGCPLDVQRAEVDKVLSFLWGDPVEANMHRGDIGEANCFGREELEAFLGKGGCSLLVRGHTPTIGGHLMYGGKLMTVHSTDYDERDDRGKVTYLEVSLKGPPLSTLKMFTIGKDLVPEAGRIR